MILFLPSNIGFLLSKAAVKPSIKSSSFFVPFKSSRYNIHISNAGSGVTL